MGVEHPYHRTSKVKRIKIALRCLPEIYYKIAVVEQLLQDEKELQKIQDENEDNK